MYINQCGTKVERTWPVRAAPKIIVDVFDGGIWVHPGEPGAVRATVEPYSSCKNGSVEEAENALKVVDVARLKKAIRSGLLRSNSPGRNEMFCIHVNARVYSTRD